MTCNLRHPIRLRHSVFAIAECNLYTVCRCVQETRLTTKGDLCVTWLLYVWHDSSMCDMTPLCVTWLARIWYVLVCVCRRFGWQQKEIYVWHDSSMCDMTPLCVTWLARIWYVLVCVCRRLGWQQKEIYVHWSNLQLFDLIYNYWCNRTPLIESATYSSTPRSMSTDPIYNYWI